jgi:signal-transduction protein with cAMP-binding, CBS, and nucleotidyltransferase domain
MTREDLNQLPVVADHHIEGMLSRGDILQVMKSRIELSKR